MAVSSRGAQVIAWSYIVVVIAAIAVGLRLLVRLKYVHMVGREDICVIFALVFSLLTANFMHLQVTRGGLGSHFDGEEKFMEFLKMSYFSIFFYNCSLCLSKFAILLLCLRIFGPSKWKYACYGVLGFLSLYSAWVIMSTMIPCVPIRLFWDKSLEGWCFPSAVSWFTNAGLNIFTDVLIVILPLPGIYQLQLPKKQKIGVSLVFLLGFFVCIISVVRLYALHTGAVTTDPTYDNFAIAIWSIVEVNGAIVGACLPTLKPLITRFFPQLLSSGLSRPRGNTHSYYRHGTGNDGTNRSNLGRERPIPDFSSATQILAEDDEGVVLKDMDRKNKIQVRTEYEITHENMTQRSEGSGYSFDSQTGKSGNGIRQAP